MYKNENMYLKSTVKVKTKEATNKYDKVGHFSTGSFLTEHSYIFIGPAKPTAKSGGNKRNYSISSIINRLLHYSAWNQNSRSYRISTQFCYKG